MSAAGANAKRGRTAPLADIMTQDLRYLLAAWNISST